MLSLTNLSLHQIVWPHSGTTFLTFAADFPVESLLGISLLTGLLFLSFQLGTVHSFSDKKEIALL
jgi:hypothetical protein